MDGSHGPAATEALAGITRTSCAGLGATVRRHHGQNNRKTLSLAFLFMLVAQTRRLTRHSPWKATSEQVVGAYLLNLVAVDPIHNAVHLAIGLSGLWASRSERLARRWGLGVGAALLALFVVGMAQAALEGFPPDQVLLLVTLNSPGHALHLVTGGIALYLGVVKLPARAEAKPGIAEKPTLS